MVDHVGRATGFHVALLGDSVFDNGRYTGGEPDVLGHLRPVLPPSWTASLHARDGSVTYQLGEQLAELPAQASHLVVSIGGNDLLLMSELLSSAASSTAEVLEVLGARRRELERGYRQALEPVLALGREVTVCTVYGGSFPGPLGELAQVAVSVFDDVILRFAFERGLGVIELRAVCTGPKDFVDGIEPSGQGGRKIARVVAQAVGALPVTTPGASRVFVSRD